MPMANGAAPPNPAAAQISQGVRSAVSMIQEDFPSTPSRVFPPGASPLNRLAQLGVSETARVAAEPRLAEQPMLNQRQQPPRAGGQEASVFQQHSGLQQAHAAAPLPPQTMTPGYAQHDAQPQHPMAHPPHNAHTIPAFMVDPRSGYIYPQVSSQPAVLQMLPQHLDPYAQHSANQPKYAHQQPHAHHHVHPQSRPSLDARFGQLELSEQQPHAPMYTSAVPPNHHPMYLAHSGAPSHIYTQVGLQPAYYPTMAPQPIYALVHPGSLAPMYAPLQQPVGYAAAAHHHAQNAQFGSRPSRGHAGANAHHDEVHASASSASASEHKARGSRSSRAKGDRDGGGGASRSGSGREGVRSSSGSTATAGPAADEQASRRMLEFRERKGEYELEDIVGYVVEFAKDQVSFRRRGSAAPNARRGTDTASASAMIGCPLVYAMRGPRRRSADRSARPCNVRSRAHSTRCARHA
jgi:hypothetical protein